VVNDPASRTFRVAIIGGGPAGLMAADALARAAGFQTGEGPPEAARYLTVQP